MIESKALRRFVGLLSADRQPRLHAVRAPDISSRAYLTTTYGDGTSPTSVLWFILPVASEQRLARVEPSRFRVRLRSEASPDAGLGAVQKQRFANTVRISECAAFLNAPHLGMLSPHNQNGNCC